MKEVKLPCYGIRINLTEDGGGSITSDLHEDDPPAEGEDEKLYNAAIDGIESIVRTDRKENRKRAVKTVDSKIRRFRKYRQNLKF